MTAETGVVYGTRWRRTGVVMLLALLAMVAVLMAARAQLISSALMVTQSRTSELATSGLEGSDVGLGMTTVTRSTGTSGGSDTKYVLRAGFADGKLDGLCVSQVQTIGGLPFTIKVTGGDGVLGTYEIQGSNAMLDVVSMRSTTATGSTSNGINLDGRAMLGVAASDITTTSTGGVPDINPLDAPTGVGWYGIDADRGNLYNVRGDAYDLIIGGPFSMPGMSITVVPGSTSGCKSGALPR